MTYQTANYGQKNKLLTLEQCDKVIEAILAGKYSWACLLMLRFVGENPLLYIPYRTYNRLMKESHQADQPSKHRTKIEDLDYLEKVDKSGEQVKGGMSYFKNFWH